MEQAVLVGLHNDQEIIYLNGPEFSLGRGLQNSYVCKDLTVSRCHCVFKFENNKWTVIDRSSNGTKLNSKQISKSNSQPMENNDILQLNDIIQYRFHYPYNANKRRRVENNNSPIEATANLTRNTQEKIYVIPDDDIQETSSRKSEAPELSELKHELTREKAIIKKLTDDSKEMQSKIFGLEVDLFNKISSSVKLEQEIIDLKNSCTSLQKERDQLQTQLASYESETNTLRQRLEKSQAVSKLNAQTDNSEEEDKSLLRCVLRAEILEKECNIKIKINSSLSLLRNVCSNDTALGQIQTYISELQTDVDELIVKRNELDCNNKVQVVADDKADSIKEELFNIMETDLQCSICNEIFIKSTSLNCGHTFCKLCIEQWKKQKNTCPVCRVPIKNFLPCIAIDNYVDQTIELLSPNKKEVRAKLKETHEASTSKSANRREIASNSTQTVYVSSDSESDSEDWDTEDFSDYSDYYGGYGACFICGAPDHWANSCPQRRGGGGGRPRRR